MSRLVRRHPRLPVTFVGSAVCLAGAMLALGCGSDDGTSGGGDGSCTLVGEAHELPASQDFAVERVAGGFVVVLNDDESGVASWRIDSDGIGARVDITGVSTNGRPHMGVGPSGTVLGVVPNNWQADTAFAAYTTTDGSTWTAGDSLMLSDATTFSGRTHDVAVSNGGTVAVVWTEGISSVTLNVVAVESDGTVTSGMLDTLEFGGEVHAAFAGESLSIAALARDGGELQLMDIGWDSAGGFQGHIAVGPAPGSLGNIEITDVTGADDGSLWAAETRSGSFDEDGQTNVYRGTSGGWERVGRVTDDRVVANWNAVADLSGDRAVVAVAYGANNLDASASNDSVDLLLCSTGGCGRGVRLAGANGTFYGPVAVAADGTEGMAVFAAETKGGGPERVIAQGFSCP